MSNDDEMDSDSWRRLHRLYLSDYDEEDIKGLLKDRFEESKDRLETSLEVVRALCEPVHPKEDVYFIRYFCGILDSLY